MADNEDSELLEPDALTGKAVGISVSESPDLPQLGLLEDHFRLALAEIARTVLVSGGDIYYGGHLRPDGYTVFLLEELQKYGRRDKPLKICLNWAEHQSMTQGQVKDQREQIGLFGDLIFLDKQGKPMAEKDKDYEQGADISDEDRSMALTGLRHFLASSTNARVLIGGKNSGFQGAMPGLVEEMLYSIRSCQPVFLAGGFGGITSDILKVVCPEHVEWFPERKSALEERTTTGLALLQDAFIAEEWSNDLNGLTDEENALLAATYRPSELAALVGLGLGRLQV